MQSYYIVIEGLEGSGKTTARDIVADTLKTLGVKKIIFTREPGGTKLAESLRNLILDTTTCENEEINNMSEALIFYAARVQLVETIIKPALTCKNWVIGDRHDLSTRAYQGGGRGINQEILEVLHNITLNDFHPELTIYLDVTPEVGLKRINNRERLDRIEKKSLDFFNRVRAVYLESAEKNTSIYTIDAMQPLEAVKYAVRETIICWFQKKNEMVSMAK